MTRLPLTHVQRLIHSEMSMVQNMQFELRVRPPPPHVSMGKRFTGLWHQGRWRAGETLLVWSCLARCEPWTLGLGRGECEWGGRYGSSGWRGLLFQEDSPPALCVMCLVEMEGARLLSGRQCRARSVESCISTAAPHNVSSPPVCFESKRCWSTALSSTHFPPLPDMKHILWHMLHVCESQLSCIGGSCNQGRMFCFSHSIPPRM